MKNVYNGIQQNGKCAKYLKTLYKREHPNTNKHKKRYSGTFVFNDMQMNYIIYIFIANRMTKIKKRLYGSIGRV